MTTTQPDSLAGQILPDHDHHEEFPLPPGAPALRETAFFRGSAHPDGRPCPDWCDWRREGEAHGIERGRPVEHSSTRLFARASLYFGQDLAGDGERHVFATVETQLEATQGHPPQIRVSLRDFPFVKGKGVQYRFQELLKLTVDDARDLAAMLTYWADAAEQAPGSLTQRLAARRTDTTA